MVAKRSIEKSSRSVTAIDYKGIKRVLTDRSACREKIGIIAAHSVAPFAGTDICAALMARVNAGTRAVFHVIIPCNCRYIALPDKEKLKTKKRKK